MSASGSYLAEEEQVKTLGNGKASNARPTFGSSGNETATAGRDDDEDGEKMRHGGRTEEEDTILIRYRIL